MVPAEEVECHSPGKPRHARSAACLPPLVFQGNPATQAQGTFKTCLPLGSRGQPARANLTGQRSARLAASDTIAEVYNTQGLPDCHPPQRWFQVIDGCWTLQCTRRQGLACLSPVRLERHDCAPSCSAAELHHARQGWVCWAQSKVPTTGMYWPWLLWRRLSRVRPALSSQTQSRLDNEAGLTQDWDTGSIRSQAGMWLSRS